MADYTDGQRMALQIAMKTSAFLSISGSGFIVCNLISHRSSELKKTLNRLLLALSVCDLISSTWYFVGSWAVPKDSIEGEFIYGNAGTQMSCTSQGFFLQWFSFSSMLYTASLSLHFLLLIRYKWSDGKLKKVEYFFHGFSITLPLLPAIAMLLNDLYNPIVLGMCYANPYPWDCDKKDSEIDCIRGEGAAMYRLFGMFVPILICFTTIITSMTLVYLSVRKVDVKASAYASRYVQRNNKNTKAALNKACQLIGAFFISWFPVLFGSVYFELIKSSGWPFGYLLVVNITYPVNGFLNAMVHAKVFDRLKKRVRHLFGRNRSSKSEVPTTSGTNNSTTRTSSVCRSSGTKPNSTKTSSVSRSSSKLSTEEPSVEFATAPMRSSITFRVNPTAPIDLITESVKDPNCAATSPVEDPTTKPSVDFSASPVNDTMAVPAGSNEHAPVQDTTIASIALTEEKELP